MQENTMPAVEVSSDVAERELAAYELAFHILPTVAEGEVENIYSALKDHITKAGGIIIGEETPDRFDLAYDIDKYLEGRNRKFSSAYFGWIRFHLEPSVLETVTEKVEATKELLRHLIVRLTKVEEAMPFNFHESIADTKVKTIDVGEVLAAPEVVVDEAVSVEVASEVVVEEPKV